MRFLTFIFLLMTAFAATQANAYQGVMIPGENGEVIIQPLTSICEQTPAPTSDDMTLGYCDPQTMACPNGYKAVPKYCWGGFKKGFYQCGHACREKNPKCRWGDYSDPCRRGGGHR